ncbi:MAG: sigma-70 family RNA polymerase sigma factor [Deltaproteobacteria bacterium]|nr:sigma-70 family RNA polymerase sigma factor [Deltaproteobacteria bacterium]
MSPSFFQQDLSPSSASESSEDVLLRGLKEKESWAYQQLIDRWANKIYRLAFHFLRKKEDAEEIVQEVLQKVVEKIGTFQGQSSVYTWIYRIAVNQALMRLRTMKGKQFVSWEEFAPHFENGIRVQTTADWSTKPEAFFAQKELQAFLKQCVDELPEDLKTAYLLKDMEGLSEEEVCETLELSKPAMKNRVHRARLILRERLERKYVR